MHGLLGEVLMSFRGSFMTGEKRFGLFTYPQFGADYPESSRKMYSIFEGRLGP
jgi:hypothetical protein